MKPKLSKSERNSLEILKTQKKGDHMLSKTSAISVY